MFSFKDGGRSQVNLSANNPTTGTAVKHISELDQECFNDPICDTQRNEMQMT